MTGPLLIVVADDDLLFSTRIASSVTACGHRAEIVRTLAALQGALRLSPAAAILNLASPGLEAEAAIREAKADPASRTVPLLGFCGHADTRRRAAALEAGCDRVATNAEISSRLPQLLEELLAGPIPSPPSGG